MRSTVPERAIRLATLLFSLTVTMAAASAPTDGDLPPLYPGTHMKGDASKPTNEKAVLDAIKEGGAVSVRTTDAPEVVDAWYTKMLPNCSRTTIEGAHIFRHICSTRTVNISPSQGETSVNVVPNGL